MRVTQSMLSNNALRNLSNSYTKLQTLSNQIQTGKKFTKPSDDPVAVMNAMGYRTDLNNIQQYQDNIATVQSWTDSTDDALQGVSNILQKIRELTVQASNGTYEGTQRSYIADEIEQLKDEIISLGDTQVGGKYIFGGTKTDQKPSEAKYSASGEINIEVFNGIMLPLNIDGNQMFKDMVGDNGKLKDLINTLNNPNSTEEDVSAFLTTIDTQMDTVLGKISMVGARQNRVDLMSNRLSNQEVFSTRILSNNEDIDLERVAIDLTAQESVLRASLSTSASIIQPTLMDFLR